MLYIALIPSKQIVEVFFPNTLYNSVPFHLPLYVGQRVDNWSVKRIKLKCGVSRGRTRNNRVRKKSGMQHVL